MTPASKSRSTRHRSGAVRFLAVLAVAALVAIGCSGESDDDASADTGDTAATTSDSGETAADTGETAADTGSTSETGDTGGGGGETWDDPRGGIFADFQAEFDRSHPFQPLDSFCTPHEAAASPEATEPGIEADTIQVHQIRQQLENLIDIGFGVDVGDPTLMFDTYVNVINEECGGIRGRTLELGTTEYDPLSPDIEQATGAACVTATEDENAAFIMSSTGLQGTATLCIAEEHNTPYIGTIGLESGFVERAGGKLVSFDFTQDDALRYLVERIDATGELEGKTIGVIGADTPGQPDAVQAGLVDVLEDLGHEVAVYDTIGCSGQTQCTEGVSESVGDLKDAGVDVLFPTLNILSLPGYVAEMVTQGFSPGDVQFYTSNFNTQSGDLVSSKVAVFGGDAAGALYNGAVVVDSAATSNFRSDPEWPVPAFNQLCIDTYAANGGEQFEYGGTVEGMLSVVCAEVRVMARAIYDAGDNPTRDSIGDALAGLGPVDGNHMIPMSFGPDKYAAADAAQTGTWTFPCQIPDGAYDENDTCMFSNSDYELVSG
jgi:hypothetical protein